jgi:hypothetical protein
LVASGELRLYSVRLLAPLAIQKTGYRDGLSDLLDGDRVAEALGMLDGLAFGGGSVTAST